MIQIAIIGSGLSGTLSAIHLAQQLSVSAKIYLIEKDQKQLNRGVAYASEFAHQPLNVPAGKMSLFSANPSHFYDWIIRNKQTYLHILPSNLSSESFISRKIFGDYLTDTFKKVVQTNPLVKVEYINDEAIDITEDFSKDGYVVLFKKKENLFCDKVILALGNFPPAHLSCVTPEVKQSEVYVGNPWSLEWMNNLSKDSPILFIGTGLTTVDHLLELHKRGYKGRIVLTSRRGRFPLPHDKTIAYSFPDISNLSFNAISLFKFFRAEIEKAQVQQINWQSVIDSFREQTARAWQKLSTEEQKRFMRHLRAFWDIHRHRIPVESLDVVKEMQETKQLEIINGRISSIRLQEQMAMVDIGSTQIQVQKIINCTGPECDYKKIPIPLIKELLVKDWIKPDDLNLGIACTAGGHVINSEGRISEGLICMGSMRKGILWESTALRELRQQAESLSKIIEKKYNFFVTAAV